MVWPQESQKPFLFRMISPKSSQMSPELLPLLNNFEVTLAMRIRKLNPKTTKDAFSLPWLSRAMRTLCEIHSDVLNLITAMELPVSDWDDKWIGVYLDNSVKLLDICNAFSSEISHLKQGNLFTQCALHNMNDGATESQFMKACSSLDLWKRHVSKKNPRIDNCFYIIDHLVRVIDQPKIKNSSKGKALMRAMYGVKVFTISICSVFAAALSGSAKKLIDLQVSETHLWAEAFTEFRTFVNMEIRRLCSNGNSTVLKEVEAVETSIKNVSSSRGLSSDLRVSSEKLSEELHQVAEDVDRFFMVVLKGRDALLSNVKVGDDLKVGGVGKMGSPMVR